jgi:hypothetical protein
MADRVTYHVEVNDYTKGDLIVGTLNLEIGSRDGSVFIRLVNGDSMTLAGTMTAPQAQAMIKGPEDAIRNIG